MTRHSVSFNFLFPMQQYKDTNGPLRIEKLKFKTIQRDEGRPVASYHAVTKFAFMLSPQKIISGISSF